MKGQLMKIKIAYLCVCMLSCSNFDKQQNKDNRQNSYDIVCEIIINNQDKIIQQDTVSEDSENLLVEINKYNILEYFDYCSEIELHYEYYIGLAYDENIYKKYFKKKDGQNKLDSLIDIYIQKKIIYFKYYIGLAYDIETFLNYINTWELDKIESLIELYKINESSNNLTSEENE